MDHRPKFKLYNGMYRLYMQYMYIVQGISISFFQSQELDNSSQNRLIQIMCHGKISQLVEIGQECLYVLSTRSSFLIGNGKCKQLSNWSELELSTADRVFPQLLHSVSFTVISIRDCE